MASDTIITRREAHSDIKPKKASRQSLVLDILKDRQMTVEDIMDELLAKGYIKYFNRNFVAPRLTELKDAGIVETVGTKKSCRSEKQIAVWQKKRA